MASGAELLKGPSLGLSDEVADNMSGIREETNLSAGTQRKGEVLGNLWHEKMFPWNGG